MDPVGLLLAVVFTAASMQDRDGAKNLLAILQHKFSRLRLIWADQAYAGPLVPWVKALRRHRPIHLDIVKRSKGTKGVEVSPKRWIVERTRGWFNCYRRLSKDYELYPQTREAIVRVVIIHLMLRRLARTPPFWHALRAWNLVRGVLDGEDGVCARLGRAVADPQPAD